MAANAPPELASGNPCCLAWQGKYIGMKKRRDAFKEAVTLLQNAISNVNAEKANLEKQLVEMVANRDSKEDTSAVKSSLEKEISVLKSEILSLQQNLKEKSEETNLLQVQASSGEKEISKLKDLRSKETLRADNSEEEREKVFKELNKTWDLTVKDEEIKPDVPDVREEISMLENLLASERQKTELERKKADSEKEKADQYLSELEVLRTTAHKTSSDLHTLTSTLETVKKQLALEKQNTLKEKKRADVESTKAREQMKLAEGLSKKIEIVSAKNEELRKETELQSASSKIKFGENSAKLEEKTKLLEMNKKTALNWKSRANDLTQQLKEAKIVIEGLKKQVNELLLSQKSIKTDFTSQKTRDLEKAEVRLLKKELKLKRECAKHSKKVAKFENFRREFQAAELGRLKLEFSSVTNRMNLLEKYFSKDNHGTAGHEKADGCRKLQMLQSQKNCNGEKHSDGRCHLVASSGSQEQAPNFSAQLVPRSQGGESESVSGTISQWESPTRGSRKLQSSGVISSTTSFSDGQLLVQQGREQLPVTTSAKIAKNRPNIQPTKPNIVREVSNTKKNRNFDLLAGNYLQSRRNEIQKVVNEDSRKRKRMLEAVDSRNHLSSDDKKKNFQTGEKMGSLLSKVETGYRPSEKEEILAPDLKGRSSANGTTISKKRRISSKKKPNIQNSLEIDRTGKTMCLSTAKEHDLTTLFLGDIASIDCMKFLELDNLEDENYYKMARESLLSPDLPQVNFLGGEIVNKEKNPVRALDLAVRKNIDSHETVICGETTSLNTQHDLVTVKVPPPSTILHGYILKHFVVFSKFEDQNSVIKIFHAANNCVQRSPSVTKAQWAVPVILSSLRMEENLLAQERVCVFLSLLLHNFSAVFSTKFGNTLAGDFYSCLDSFSKHIYSVMADNEVRVMLSEFLEELLSLLQDLLTVQRILFFVKSSETSEADISISVTLNGENVALVSKIALIDHLVAGSAFLAAICTSWDRVGFICEASFEILHKKSQEETSVPLTILHVFAYIAGEKMMSSNEHDISIAVLKSIVMSLENRHSGIEEIATLHPGKNKCHFADRSSSLESVASMLMKIVHEFTHSNTLHQSLATSSLGSSHLEKNEFLPVHKDFQCILTRDKRYNLCDVLSLVELIACYTVWDWTSANIVAPLLKMLRLPLPINLSVAIVSLLGQLSSIGVDAGGYENEGISILREKLSAFLQSEATLEAGFAVQIATVSSLLKTLQLDLPIALQSEITMSPGCGDQSLSASANLITKWFSLLSCEQRVFASEFLQTSDVR